MKLIDDRIRRPEDWPGYWFAALEKAVEEGDHEAAADAQGHLRRLGVHVRYGRPGGDRLPAPVRKTGVTRAS